jgi:hypothetical protein
MLLLWIAGLLEGIPVDLQAPESRRWSECEQPRPQTLVRGRMTPEFPSGFL